MKRGLGICYAVIVIVGVFLLMSLETKVWNLYGKPYCLADCLVASGYPWIFGLFYLPATLLLVMGTGSEVTNANFVLCFSSRRAVWKWQMKRALRYSAGCGAVFAAAAMLGGSLQSTVVFNWQTSISAFYESTGMRYDGNFVWICVLFCFWCVWKTFFWLVLQNLLRLWDDRGYICWIVLIGVVCVEWASEHVRFFFSVFHIGYEIMENERNIVLSVLGAGGLLAALLWGGKCMAERREF